ncbi:unnamed protein product [Effrenium voratum]|uniref:Uncharacterized protein n=1 Tax=Effrenium voratum TaxID=2562239 RepID=A0AA36IRI5_9DINO|nr:unnamed protein product [Effrenium voratum]CAJ1420723.1 unnamed protein product [Effrenium voratum]CAJ1444067.1 unnamed protein product [Effrenium voratum]
MEAFAESVLRPGILVLQLGLLLKLIQLVVSFLQANAWSLRSMVARGNQKWREQWNKIKRQYLEEADASDHSGQELARMRCSWTRTTWWVFLAINLPRLLLRQVRRSPGDQTGEEFEIGLVWVCAMGLVIVWCPRLINPCSQDVLYMMAALGMDAAIVIAGLFHNIDVRDVITLTFPGRFMYAVLANRASCVVFCITAHLLQAIHLSVARHAQDSQAAGSGVTIPDLLAIFLAMFWGILAVRRLLLENVLLRVDVQKRTVELGAVSSLLAACYDAVLEVDQGLRLAHDSPQLSSMLLRTQRASGLSEEVLPNLFHEEDRARISEQFRTSTSQSATALNADILDSDFNRVKVELVCVQFDNLTNDRCFLVGIREIQDFERGSLAAAPLHPPTSSAADFCLVFDLQSLEIQIMSDGMKQLCKSLHPSDSMPDSILDIVSPESHLSLRSQLQRLKESDEAAAVTLKLLGFGERQASVTREYDQFLERWVANMFIPTATLTQSNLRSLPDERGRHLGRGRSDHSSLSSRSSRSRRSRSLRSSSRAESRAADLAGSITQLHVTKIPL